MNSNFWKMIGSEVVKFCSFMKELGGWLVEFFIFMQKCGFMLIADGIKNVQDDSAALGILGIVFGVIVIAVVLLLDGLALYGIYYAYKRISIKIRTKKVEYHKAIGQIIGKKHESSHMSTVLVGKNFLPVYHPEEYNVYVEYKGITEVFHSEWLFNQCEEGGRIEVIVVFKLNKRNEIIEATLELPG